MTLDSIKRATDPVGDDIGVLTIGGKKVQAVALVDATGQQIGLALFPLQVAGTVDVNNFPTTQPISGSVSVSNLPATQPVSAASLPLPTGAATDAVLLALTFQLLDYAVASATVAYLGKERSSDAAWLVVKVDTTTGAHLIYAGHKNNTSVNNYASAWAARATLTYGLLSEAL